MKRMFLVKQGLALIVGFICLNGLVALLTRHSVPRQLIRSIDASPPVSDLFVGNSLIAAGIDVPSFEQAAPGSRALNIGLGSSYAVEHDLLLRRALRTAPRRVYYGFFDTQLTDNPRPGFDQLAGNSTLVHYLDRETAIHLLCPDDPITAGRIRLVSHLPVLVERMALWAKVENLRRQLGGLGLPPQQSNQFGRAGDFTLLEAGNARAFARSCVDSAEHWTGFSTPVADIVSLARSKKAAFFFVEMPMTSSHRNRFYSTPEWRTYKDALRKQAIQDGAAYIEAASWISDDGFADPLHLNAKGASVFSQRLAAGIARTK